MRILLMLVAFLTASYAFADSNNDDWRKTGTQQEKLDNVGESGPPYNPDIKLTVTSEYGCFASLLAADTALTIVAPNQLIFPKAFKPTSTAKTKRI